MIRSCRRSARSISAWRRSSSTTCSSAPISSRCIRRSPTRPRTSSTRMRSPSMKKGVRIVNCARGGLVDEAALRSALDAGQVAGAAFDVFTMEPATENPLFGHPNVVCTPHLGASTSEAQENVALQVAEQMSDYLLRGAISNAVNFPSITAEEAPQAEAVHHARREARLVRRPAHRNRRQESADHVRRRGRADEDQGADLGRARRPAAARCCRTSTWCRRRSSPRNAASWSRKPPARPSAIMKA